MGFPESGLGDSDCAFADVAKAKSPITIAARGMRRRSGCFRVNTMAASLEKMWIGFKEG
jgi:hypothetical protein